jgi:hypothetical protein
MLMMMLNNGRFQEGHDQDEVVRQLLRRDWSDMRVTVEGWLEKITEHNDPKKAFKIALIKDAVVTLPNRERYELSHNWIQKAETLKDILEGTKVRFTARVRAYSKQSGHETAGFTLPDNVEVVTPSALAVAKKDIAVEKPKPSLAVGVQLVALLEETKKEVERLGGVARVRAFVEFVEAQGGVENVKALLELSSRLGGVGALQSLLPFMG